MLRQSRAGAETVLIPAAGDAMVVHGPAGEMQRRGRRV